MARTVAVVFGLSILFTLKFESSHGLGHIFDFVSCIPDVAYVPMSNFLCHCLIDGLLTNQIALLLPVRGWTEFGKMFGIKGRRFLSSPPLPLLTHPLPPSPQYFGSPQACSFARPLFVRLFDLRAAWKWKGIGCYAGYGKGKILTICLHCVLVFFLLF